MSVVSHPLRSPTLTRGLALLLAVWLLAAAPLVGQAQPTPAFAPPPERSYDIPAQSLNGALQQFATASGVDILYDHALAAGRRSTALSGVYSPQRAILVLLQGTGLSCRFTNRNAAILFPDGRPDVATTPNPTTIARAGPTLDLDVMHVTAAPIVGSAHFDAYGRIAQRDIYARLRSDPILKDATFNIEIQLELDAQGAVRQTRLTQSSGDARLDGRILALLSGARLSQPPPAGLPQPMRFRIAAQ